MEDTVSDEITEGENVDREEGQELNLLVAKTLRSQMVGKEPVKEVRESGESQGYSVSERMRE